MFLLEEEFDDVFQFSLKFNDLKMVNLGFDAENYKVQNTLVKKEDEHFNSNIQTYPFNLSFNKYLPGVK